MAAPPTTRRLTGVDCARGLAVLGMYATHVGPDPDRGGVTGFICELATGRSSALFALLAGFSLTLITGRPRPRTGRAGRQAVGRILIRAVVLLVVGTALSVLDTPVNVILAYYGLAFFFVLPLYRLRASLLATIAATTALLAPQILYAIRISLEEGSWGDTVSSYDPLTRISGADGLLDLLFTGSYPVLTWLPFLLAGMAVGRLDLGRYAVRVRLAVTGGALAVLGYGGSWLALHLVPHGYAALGRGTDGPSPSSAWWSDTVGDPIHPFREWLLVAAPHSETTPSIVGNTGVALAVLAVCLIALDRLPHVRRLAAPVIAVGTMALTTYVLQILAIWLFWGDDLPSSLLVLLGFSAAAMAFAVVWSRLFPRGPLEYLLHTATKPARLIK
ncbi:DUF418 domain-containing protein [Streptomyces sp. NPDC053542]|uniref:DUF418 domain-containing protein n=1 Tax=Streptomyces sp. NPDC053542 TaxID=3365710 RepID=UPI0037D51262